MKIRDIIERIVEMIGNKKEVIIKLSEVSDIIDAIKKPYLKLQLAIEHGIVLGFFGNSLTIRSVEIN